MAARSNAASGLTRLWFERARLSRPGKPSGAREGELLGHRLHRAAAGDQAKVRLPDGVEVGPRLSVETKDEHDGPSGREFGKMLRADVVGNMWVDGVIPTGTTNVKFTMLKAEHFEVASKFFGAPDLDRLFVVHSLDAETRAEVCPVLAQRHRIHWIMIPEMVLGLFRWYEQADRAERVFLSAATLRETPFNCSWDSVVLFPWNNGLPSSKSVTPRPSSSS